MAEKATLATAAYFDLPEDPNHYGTVGELEAVLREAGIDYAMVFSAATTAHQVEHINRYILAEAEKEPKFIPCGTLHADYEGYKGELRWMRDHGIHGVKLHPEFQHFALDDARCSPCTRRWRGWTCSLIAHMGDPRVDVSGPAHMLPIARTFPKLRCIAAHLGNWGDWGRGQDPPLAQLPNVYTDISSSFSYVKDPLAPLRDPPLLRPHPRVLRQRLPHLVPPKGAAEGPGAGYPQRDAGGYSLQQLRRLLPLPRAL